jgi:hypothetical protein
MAVRAASPQRRLQLDPEKQAGTVAYRAILQLQGSAEAQTLSPLWVPGIPRRQRDPKWKEPSEMVGTVKARRVPRLVTKTRPVGLSCA